VYKVTDEPLDGEEGELIEDEGCYIDVCVRSCIGALATLVSVTLATTDHPIDILSMLPDALSIYALLLSISPTSSHASVCLVSGYVLPVTGSSSGPSSTELVLESTMQSPESKQQLPPPPSRATNHTPTFVHCPALVHAAPLIRPLPPWVTHFSWDVPVPRKPVSPVPSPLGQLYPTPLVRLDGDVLHVSRDRAPLGRYGAVPDVPAQSHGRGLLRRMGQDEDRDGLA